MQNSKSLPKKFYYAVLVSLISIILTLIASRISLFAEWENATWDWRCRSFAKSSSVTDKIAIISLDQQTLDWAEREFSLTWKWPRAVYAPIIAYCQRQGAKAVIFDVLFTEESNLVGDDAALAQAIKNGPPFVLPINLSRRETTKNTGSDTFPEKFKTKTLPLKGLSAWLTKYGKTLSENAAKFPVAKLAAPCALLGNIKEEPDPDRIIRRVSLFRIFNNQVVPSLGLAAAWLGNKVELEIKPGYFKFGNKKLPIDSEGKVLLHFKRPDTYPKISAAAVMQSELNLAAGEKAPIKDNNLLRDKYVFFGFTAKGLLDWRSAPVAPIFSGVEFHATLLDNLLAGEVMRDTPLWGVWLAVICFATLGGTVPILLCRSGWHNAIAFFILLPLPLLLGYALYNFGLWWPIILPESATGLAFIGGTLVNYLLEEKEKYFIKNAFRFYLSSSVMNQLLADPARLRLGGERRRLSILFTDLQGFTGISERLEPEELTALLNDYLSDMTDIILTADGTLDKYEGDAIIAFWNAPLNQPDHALRACHSALKCQLKLAERRAEFFKRTGVKLFMRIGINTGEVVVGNMGSRVRFDYTVLGDAANLAARLEGANKFFNTYTMISEATCQELQQKIICRQLGKLRVVGKGTATTVFEPLCRASEKEPVWLQQYNNALELCQHKQWQQALAEFSRLPDDPVAKLYARRCQELLASRDDWDNIWNLTSK